MPGAFPGCRGLAGHVGAPVIPCRIDVSSCRDHRGGKKKVGCSPDRVSPELQGTSNSGQGLDPCLDGLPVVFDEDFVCVRPVPRGGRRAWRGRERFDEGRSAPFRRLAGNRDRRGTGGRADGKAAPGRAPISCLSAFFRTGRRCGRPAGTAPLSLPPAQGTLSRKPSA